ncbi:MAG: cytochrome c3 family protein [Fidelibacterota bacterium]
MSRYSIILMLSVILSGQTTDYIRFSHPLHVEDEELECTTCHSDVSQSTQLDYSILPTMDVCSDCHEVEDDENCSICHMNTDDPLSYQEFHHNSGLPFSHKRHLSRFTDCGKCHGATLVDDGEERYQAWDESQCRQCHSINKPENHMPGWKDIHGSTVVSRDENNCSMCHTQSYCDQCHALQQFEPRVHPVDFMIRHGMESRLGIKDCYTCHNIATSCYTCHVRNQHMPVDHNLPDWVNNLPEDGGLHGSSAADSPMTCKACHLDENNPTCLRCHQ